MRTTLPKWTIALSLVVFAGFAFAGGNGVNSFSEVWSMTNTEDGDVFWGVSGPYDLDGDGNNEMLGYTDFNGITLHLFEVTGNNDWDEIWTHNITDVTYSFEAADQMVDLDSDGLPELLVGGDATSTQQGFFVFEYDTLSEDFNLNRVSSFQPLTMAGVGTGGSVSSLWAGDLDDDGVTEILMHETDNDYVLIFSLDPSSTFEFPNWQTEFVDSTLGYTAYGAVVGDFDADGTTNFALVEWDFNGIAFYQVDGEDTYSNLYWSDDITETDGGSLRALDAADFDGDGYTEIILPSVGGGLFLYTNSGDLSAWDPSTDFHELWWGDSLGFRGAKVGNPDVWQTADGMDVIATYGNTAAEGQVLDFEYNGGAVGDPASWDSYELTSTGGTDRWQDVAVGDFDKDGIDEIFVVSRDVPKAMMLEHDAFDYAPSTVNYIVANDDNPGWQTRGVHAGSDLDGDGKPEVAITDYNNRGIHVYEVIGDNTLEWVFSTEDTVTSYGSTPRYVVTGDLDGNGNGEFIFVQAGAPGEENGVHVWEWDGSDNGYTYYQVPIQIDGGEPDRYRFESFGIGDPDDDGQQELLIANNGSNNDFDVFLILSIDGTFTSGFYSGVNEFMARQSDGVFGGSPWGGSVGDLDGDGMKEVLFSAWDHAGLYIVEATDANTYEFQTYAWLDSSLQDGVSYAGTVTADLDGDGADELYGGMYDHGALYAVTASGSDVSDITGLVVDTSGTSTWDDEHVSWISDFGAVWSVTKGDGDGDGVEEIYSVDYNYGRIYEWNYDGGDVLDRANWSMKVVANHTNTMGGFGVTYGGDLDGDGYPELVQGFLEPPYSGGNPLGYTFAVVEETATGVNSDWTVITPEDYVLEQNYPNPFNPTTTINFSLPLAKDVSLTVYNIKGQEVVRLADNQMYQKGTHSLEWNGKDAFGRSVASGIYIYELRAGNVVKTQRMTLLK